MSSIHRASDHTHRPVPIAVAWVLLLLPSICGTATAGRNAGGAMLLHTNDAAQYTTAGADYCGDNRPSAPLPPTCAQLNTTTNIDPNTIESVVWIVGAFPDGSSPAVTAYQVGMYGTVYNSDISGYAPCGTVLELPDTGWPGSGTGTAVTYTGGAVTSQLFKMYWFAAAPANGVGSIVATGDYYGGDHHAEWVDDGNQTDFCSLFGSVGWGVPGSKNCPTSPIDGACCFHDGHCEVVAQGSCTGVYQGNGTVCVPNSCPQPIGACCSNDGTCQVTTQAACSGVWRGMDTVCNPNPCPPPTGACCFANDLCQVLTSAQCAAQGGTYHGDGTSCNPNPCGQTGACCFADGRCALYTQTECEAFCGTYQGNNTTCTPNPCPPRALVSRETAHAPLRSNPFVRGRGAPPVMGGRNVGGAMLLHVDNSICYSIGVDYCASDPLPTTCGELVTSVTRDPGGPTVIWMVGAFPSNSTPGVTAFQVGVTGDIPGGDYVAYGTCSLLELPDPTWPSPGTGTACAFGNAVNSQLFKMYWFAVTAPGAGSNLGTTNYPGGDHLAEWADDSAPPRIDVCSNFGTVVWGSEGHNQCPSPLQAGACCYPDGSCIVLLQSDCTGQYMGDHSVCDPNPCPMPTGACCFPDGHCTVLTLIQCQQQGGAYRGNGISCDPNPCPQPTGACCFPDGHCSAYTLAYCQAQGGVYQGPGTTCTPNPCPQPSGACCFVDGHCAVLSQSQCQQQGGSYQGNAAACDPNPCTHTGACCFHDGHCTILTQTQCQQQAGGFQGDGSLCSPNPCPQPTGACCFHDGHCVVETQSACGTQGGTWLGIDTVCDPNPCSQPTGACCFHDGHCVVATQSVCGGQGGIWQGMDTICTPNPCPPPMGACCFVDGHCALITGTQCQQQGGSYQGNDTVCDPNPCTHTGACCFADGHCTILTTLQCQNQGGSYHGDGITCGPNPCPQPTGACCFLDSHCSTLTRLECQQEGGAYRGDGTTCDPNPCSQAGACCFSDGHCTLLTVMQCVAQGGTYQGNGTVCDPNPCCQHGAHDQPWDTSRPISYVPGSGIHNVVGATRDVCWSEPADINGLIASSEQILAFGLETEAANDFVPTGSLSHATWWGGYYNNSTPCVPCIATPGFNLRFYEDAGCTPGTLIADLSITDFTQVAIGCQSGAYPMYKWGADLSVTATAGNLYWFGAQMKDHVFPPQSGRLSAAVVTGCGSMFRSVYFGFPNWTPVEDVFGVAFDCSQEFTCGGPPGGVGACCVGGTCRIESASECQAAGGIYMGDGTTCNPNPCVSTPTIRATWGRIKGLYR